MAFSLPINLLRKLRERSLLTAAGGALTLGAALVVRFAGVENSDLFALAAGGGFLLLTAFCICETLALYIRLRRELTCQFRHSAPESYARERVSATLAIDGISLFPLFQIEVTLHFATPDGEHAPVLSSRHIVRGQSSNRLLEILATFPHRGLWELSHIQCRTGDRFGLTAMEWKIPLGEALEIVPRCIELRPLPIVAASARSGDELSHTRERTGDPYDTKPYDPGDGIKRILWKTYARTGELIVRRAEPAIIPEGEVPLFLVAKREDDRTAGALLGYVRQLERQSIQILFSTDGDPEPEHSTTPAAFQQISSRLIRAVWSDRCGSGRDFQGFLLQLEDARRFTNQVIVFGSAEDHTWIYEVMDAAARHHLQITVALVPEGLGQLTQTEPTSLSRFMRKTPLSQHERLMSTIRTAEQSGAQVLVCETTE